MGYINIPGSSNGRTSDFGSDYFGSNPSPGAFLRFARASKIASYGENFKR